MGRVAKIVLLICGIGCLISGVLHSISLIMTLVGISNGTLVSQADPTVVIIDLILDIVNIMFYLYAGVAAIRCFVNLTYAKVRNVMWYGMVLLVFAIIWAIDDLINTGGAFLLVIASLDIIFSISYFLSAFYLLKRGDY